jgi:GNAT superfamily N-acetyltransferase
MEGEFEMDISRTARRATLADIDVATTVITSAFAEDPLWSWALARPDGGIDHHGAFWQVILEGALRYPSSWITDGGEAVSVWIPPGEGEMTTGQEECLEHLAMEFLGPRADMYLEVLTRLELAHPRHVDHYYLSLLATDPEFRGRGFGMWLLGHDLEIIDSEHAPAYLESSNAANNLRYQSVGFEPFGEVTAPNNGPSVTTMWRHPR